MGNLLIYIDIYQSFAGMKLRVGGDFFSGVLGGALLG
jgi:hypothetical protein